MVQNFLHKLEDKLTRYCKCGECIADGGRAGNCNVIAVLDKKQKLANFNYCIDCSHYLSNGGWCSYFKTAVGVSGGCTFGERRR